ncbi:MAG: pyruvate, water dikinase regulatory protein, partial [Clostridiales bacterium]
MKPLLLYIISDSVGETGEQVARAAVSQFVRAQIEFKRFPHVSDTVLLKEIVADASVHKGVIFYTLVSETLRLTMEQLADDYNVAVVDILGAPIHSIEDALNTDPSCEVGGLRKLDARYFRRVAAVEFAVQYDDGKDPQGFLDADLVVLGVSRTSKTPVCMYLAHKNIKAANLPIVPEVPIPDVIFQVPREKIFGLTINPKNLNEIRTQRLKIMGAEKIESNYADASRLQEELDFAKKLYRRIGCRVLDVTNK